MYKITDSQYHLPYVEAVASFGVLDSGTTKPMKVRGIDMDTGKRGQYVVKYKNANRMTIEATCREILGLWIGIELGLNMVEPVAVNITEDFVETIKGNDGYNSARNSIGLNFGSVYVEGYHALINGKPLMSDKLTNEAKEIFAFDMFISNADRGAGKPNVLTNGDNFLLFDHELAFSFVLLLPSLQNKTPWILGDGEREMYKNHYFNPCLKDSDLDFDEFTERFLKIDDNFWKRVYQFMPNDWITDDIKIIKDYLKAITDNYKTFSEQLQKVLLS